MGSHSYSGKLIVFEGIDGSGKTTLAEKFRELLTEEGISCVVTTAPSPQMKEFWAWKDWHGSPSTQRDIDELGLSIMAMGDRLISKSAIILPALKAGKVVISDRYILSVLAYWSTIVHRFVAERLIAPDVGIFCRIDPEVACERLERRGNESPHLQNLEMLEKLATRYDWLLQYYHYHEIDSTHLTVDESMRKLGSIVGPVIRHLSQNPRTFSE
jgi:dTMP kinase